MTINLGLVELGGDTVDDVELNGYVYRFAESDCVSCEIRSYYNLRRLLDNVGEPYPDLRIYVNYDSQECLAVITKILCEHKHMCSHITLLFKSGAVLRIK